MNKLATCASLLAGLAVLPLGVAWADATVQQPAVQIIETRQAGQDLVYSIVTDMKAAVAAKADVKPFADQANAMARWFHNFPGLFPAGTESGHDTKAKPNVFSDPAGFAKAAEVTSAAAASLATAAKSGDEAAFVTQFKALGQSCGACHREYRVRTD